MTEPSDCTGCSFLSVKFSNGGALLHDSLYIINAKIYTRKDKIKSIIPVKINMHVLEADHMQMPEKSHFEYKQLASSLDNGRLYPFEDLKP